MHEPAKTSNQNVTRISHQKTGSTGDPPLGTEEGVKQSVNFGNEEVLPVPSGQWPDGTGGSPVLPKAGASFRWLWTGDEALAQMLQEIESARRSVCLEMFIVRESAIAEKFRAVLVSACQRGLEVRVLIDALGSIQLPESFWDPLTKSGGEFHWFNPLAVGRLGIRDHRKILVCDDQVAFIGGLNIAPEYQGDGINSGWHDFGLKIHGPLAKELARAFDEMFQLADFKHRRFARLRKSIHQKTVWSPGASLLLSTPGRETSPVQYALHTDFEKARKIQIICAYFLPTSRIRRALSRVAHHGGKVQLILAGKSDVPWMRFASQSMYRRLLRAGVEIYEYQPQILHAKLIVIDDRIVYAGSANLDIRSLQLNYELLVRLEDEDVAQGASDMFKSDLKHCRRIELKEWVKARTVFAKIKSRLAYLVLARLDPFLAIRQMKKLRAG